MTNQLLQWSLCTVSSKESENIQKHDGNEHEDKETKKNKNKCKDWHYKFKENSAVRKHGDKDHVLYI